MRKLGSKNICSIIVLLVAVTLSACGSVSKNIASDGRSAGELEWPSPHSVTSTHEGGTFPDVSQLRLVQSGMNKHQISKLIGYPHYNEGLVGVREWNYLFSFHTPNSTAVMECQYKVLFDDKKLARSFYWQPASCADVMSPPKEAAAIAQAQTFTLSTDALFAFDKAALADIKPNGEEGLDSLARRIATASPHVGEIMVAGYTDRLGTELHNAKLSQQRADTVMRYLVSQGVATDAITATGRGAADPVKQCAEASRNELIACLAPNRRVEVTVSSK